MAKNVPSRNVRNVRSKETPKNFISGFGNANAIFGEQKDDDDIHPQLIKIARKSGQLNLSNKALSKVPQKVFYLNELDVEEAKQMTVNMSMDSSEDRWWERSELTRLFLNSNALTNIDPLINNLASLQLLDISDNRLKTLPNEVGDLKCLTRINLSRNDLEVLPESIGQLDELKSLTVSHNNLTCLPDSIRTLYLLEILDASHNSLESLPPSIGFLQRLDKLVVSDNKLKSLPEEIGDLFALKKLDATRNELESLPRAISNLTKIEEICLRHNKLTAIPPLMCDSLRELYFGANRIKKLDEKQVENLPRCLKVLDLSENGLESLPDEITLLQSLERLDLTSNYITSLPFHMGYLPHLKSLSLEGNTLRLIRRDIVQRGTSHLLKYIASKVAEPINSYPGFADFVPTNDEVDEKPVPDQYQMRNAKVMAYNEKTNKIPAELFKNGHLATVRTADLSQNILQSLPEELQQLSNHLQDLIVSQNKLTCLPNFVGDFKHLAFINVQNNQMDSLPAEISKLAFLREINISFNRFTSLPLCVFQVANLEILFAGDNKIREIPIQEMLKLTRLATLDLHNNDINFVPPLLGKMTQINTLLLEGNPFRVPRSSILAKGTRTLMEYLQSRIVEEPS